MAKVYDMTKGSIIKNLVLVALPVLLTSISQMAYNLTDMFWIGRVDAIGLNESDAISGIGTASYLTWFAFGVMLIAKIGTSVKVSHAVGSQEHHRINHYASNGMTIALVLGLVYAFSMFMFKEPLISIFNIPKASVIEFAIDYLSIVGSFIFIQFIISGFSSINEGLGKTSINFSILVVGLIMNMILDPLFILTLRWGVQGAAIATVLSQLLTLIIFFLYYLINRKTSWQFQFKLLALKPMKEIFNIGIFSALQSMFFTTISIVIARMIFVYGEQVMAAQRIGSQVEQLTWMIAGGFQTALTVFVGQNFGAKAPDRIKKGTLLLSQLLISYALVITALLFFFSESLMKLFVDDVRTVAYGKQYLRIISMAQLFMMLEGIGTGLFNGLGKSIVPSITGIVGNTLRLPGAIWLSSAWGYQGIWWMLNFSDIIKGLTMALASILMLTQLDSFIQSRKIKLFRLPSNRIQ